MLVFAVLLGGLFGAGETAAVAAPVEIAQATPIAPAEPAPAAPAAPVGDEQPDILFGELVDRLTEVSDVTITTDRYAMTFGLHDTNWVSVDNADYPIRQDAVAFVFLNLTFLIGGELLPNDPATYAALGVADPGTEGGGKRFTVRTASGEIIEDVIIGNAAPDTDALRDGVYLRRIDRGEVWLARGAVEFPTYPSEWFDPIVDYRPTDVARVVILRGTTPVLSATRTDDREFVLDMLDPAVGRAGAIADSRALRVMSQAVGSTLFDAVRPAASLTVPADAPGARFDMLSALELTVTLVELDGVTWAIYAAAAPPGSVGAAEADAINARVSGWAFQLPPSRVLLLGTDPATLITVP